MDTLTPEIALRRPDSFAWYGDEKMFVTWGLCGPVMTRDSDPRTESNFEFISADLMKRFPDDFEEYEFSHWAHGWIKQLACRVIDDEGNPTEAFKALVEWQENLQQYPVADDEHYEAKQAEYERQMEELDCD